MADFDLAAIDVPANRQAIDQVVANAESLALALRGSEGRRMSRRELTRHTLAIIQAQITLAQGARLALDALGQARATIDQGGDKAA